MYCTDEEISLLATSEEKVNLLLSKLREAFLWSTEQNDKKKTIVLRALWSESNFGIIGEMLNSEKKIIWMHLEMKNVTSYKVFYEF